MKRHHRAVALVNHRGELGHDALAHPIAFRRTGIKRRTGPAQRRYNGKISL
jgi:hypothetical protein